MMKWRFALGIEVDLSAADAWTPKNNKKHVHKAHSHDVGMARTWNTSEKKQLNVALPKVANEVPPGPKGNAQKPYYT